MYHVDVILHANGESIILTNAAKISPISFYIKGNSSGDISNNINITIENSDKSKSLEFTLPLQQALQENDYITLKDNNWIEVHNAVETECTEEQIEILESIISSIPYDVTTYISSSDNIKPIFDIQTYKGISQEFKDRLLNGKITRAYLKVLATATKPEFIINETNYLKDLHIEELRYVPSEGFIGGTVAKRLTGNFNNVDDNFNIQDREVEAYIGVDLTDDEEPTTEYIKYGTFIVQKPEDDQVNDNTTFTALDYMVKANDEYINRLEYPCTLKDVFLDAVDQLKLKTTTKHFLNEDFIVEDNQFEDGTTLRDVFKAIAQVSFNWIRVDQDNNIVMDFEKKDEITENLDIDKYYNFSKNNIYGPINTIIIKNSQVEGENVALTDDEAIRKPRGKNICINEWEFGEYNNLNGIRDEYLNRIRVPWFVNINQSTKYYIDTYNYEYKMSINTYTKEGTFIRNISNVSDFTTTEQEYYIGITLYDINEEQNHSKDLIKLINDGTIKPYIAVYNDEDNTYEPYEETGQIALTISDNPFAYTQSKRSQLIKAGKVLFGLSYVPLSLDTIGYIYLNCTDKISVENLNNTTFETYLLDHTIDYEGTASDTISSTAMTETETKYQFSPTVSSSLKRTEIIVDKNSQAIQALAEQQNSFSDYIASITVDLEGIKNEVENLYNFERTITGENEIVLDDALPINIQRFRAVSENVEGGLYPSNTLFPSSNIYPQYGGTVITLVIGVASRYVEPEPLYPSSTLYPHSTLYPKPSRYDTKEISFYINQPMHSALGKSDEFIIEYDEEEAICIAKVLRYVNYNSGNIQLYDTPQEEIIDKLDVELFQGTNYISIKEFTNWYFEATYLFNNELNKEFATRVETDTLIRQTKDEINIEVAKKVDGDEIISAINLSPEEITIQSSKLALEGYTTINGGFSIDEKGNASIANGAVKIDETGIEMADGTKIVGGDGMITQFQFSATGVVGHITGASANERIALYIPVYIPENFIITGAILYGYHTPSYVWNYSTNRQLNCYARNVKLYKTSTRAKPNISTGIFESIAPSSAGTVVSNIGGSSGKTFSSSSPERFTVNNIQESLDSGFQYLYLADYVNNPDGSDDFEAYQKSGTIDANLFVTGYLKQ